MATPPNTTAIDGNKTMNTTKPIAATLATLNEIGISLCELDQDPGNYAMLCDYSKQIKGLGSRIASLLARRDSHGLPCGETVLEGVLPCKLTISGCMWAPADKLRLFAQSTRDKVAGAVWERGIETMPPFITPRNADPDAVLAAREAYTAVYARKRQDAKDDDRELLVLAMTADALASQPKALQTLIRLAILGESDDAPLCSIAMDQLWSLDLIYTNYAGPCPGVSRLGRLLIKAITA